MSSSALSARRRLIAVLCGGFLGTLARYLLSGTIQAELGKGLPAAQGIPRRCPGASLQSRSVSARPGESLQICTKALQPEDCMEGTWGRSLHHRESPCSGASFRLLPPKTAVHRNRES